MSVIRDIASIFESSNARTVLLGTSLLGVGAGVVGTFVVLRRRALVGDAVAHASLPGICIAFLIVGERQFGALLFGALVAGLLGVACISLIRSMTRIKEDAAIGLVLGSFFGLGVALSGIVQRLPAGNKAGLDGFLFGKAASMVRQDVVTIGAVSAVVVTVVAALHKEFGLLSFDREFGRSLGRPAGGLDLLLLTLAATCTVAGLPAVGVVLMAALLIIPPAAARFWTDRLVVMSVLSGAFGLLAALAGTILSALPVEEGSLLSDIPTGPAITLAASTIFLLSMFCAPKRGVIAAFVHRFSTRRELALRRVVTDALRNAAPAKRGDGA